MKTMQEKYDRKVEWIQDYECGKCAITGVRTQWIAKTVHGSIRCSIDYKPFGTSLDCIVWNRIISNDLDRLQREYEKTMEAK